MISLEAAAWVAGVCVLLEGFFSGSEMAFVSADRAMLRRRASEGDRPSRLIEEFLEKPQRLFTTTLLGTNLSVVVSSSVLTLAVLERWPGKGEAITVALLSPAVLILGEVVPKTLFQQHADRLVRRLIYPLRAAALLFRPAAIVFGFIATSVARLLRVEERSALVTRDELRLLLDAPAGGSAAASLIPESERDMISNVLEFADRTVYDVMVSLSEVTALPAEATLEEAAAEVADKQHTRIPIYRERVDQIVGVLHAFDLLLAADDGRRGTVADLMRQPVYVPEGKPAVDLLVELQRSRQQLAVVVDEYGGATGLVTIEDILEEIVGEIEDEYDGEASLVQAEGPGLWRVKARISIVQLNRALRIELPEGEDYETLGGLVLERLKRIPREGESVRCPGATLTVLAATDRAIEEIRVRVEKRR